jgi:hypothetical protein
MKSWSERPTEVAHLLNPVYCGLVAFNFAMGYVTAETPEVDVSLFFVAIPLAMHKETRQSLPGTVRTKLHAWATDHEPLRIGLADRCRAMVPYVKEAIFFACERKLLAASINGCIVPIARKKLMPRRLRSESAREIVEKSYFVGRWLSASGAPQAIYTILGLRP